MTRKPRHFGTDGIRGVANQGMLAPEQLLALGRALGRLAGGRRVAMAADPRRSSAMIAASLAAGAASEGAGVLDLGVLPTPALAVLLKGFDAGLGVMVSASHNPMADNGVKVLAPDGSKLSDAGELRLEEEMERPASAPAPTGAGVGAIERSSAGLERYLAHLAGAFPELRLDGRTIVADCANGAASEAAPAILRRLGATVIPLFASPNGLDINDGCGAVHPERMAAEVKAKRADVGLAFDGDADRLMLADANGTVADGDRVLWICARDLKARGRLRADTVVGTVMTNFGLELGLKDEGIRLERTAVGDRWIAQRLREGGFDLGGEPSGHVIFGAGNGHVGDGIYSALAVLAVMQRTGRTLADLCSGLKPVPQILINVQVKSKPAIDSLRTLPGAIASAEKDLAGSGRVLVRYSGTENLLRVMVEGRDAPQVERLAQAVAATARLELGV